MASILEHLGFRPASLPGNSDLVIIDVPSWRPDIEGKADIVEEILRIAGLDRIAAQPLPRDDAHISSAILTPLQKRVRSVKRALAANGLTEAINWSFIGHEAAQVFGGGDDSLVLANPIASDLSDMRPSLLPGLIAASKRNAARGLRRCRSVRSRPDLQRHGAGGSKDNRRRSAARPRACRGAWTPLGRWCLGRRHFRCES